MCMRMRMRNFRSQAFQVYAQPLAAQRRHPCAHISLWDALPPTKSYRLFYWQRSILVHLAVQGHSNCLDLHAYLHQLTLPSRSRARSFKAPTALAMNSVLAILTLSGAAVASGARVQVSSLPLHATCKYVTLNSITLPAPKRLGCLDCIRPASTTDSVTSKTLYYALFSCVGAHGEALAMVQSHGNVNCILCTCT